MLAGLQAGQVQLLKRNKKGKVTVSTNETDIVGWSADEILRNFLDVRNPTDLRTDERLRKLQVLRRKQHLSKKETRELERLRNTISEGLLAGPISGDIERITDILRPSVAEMPAEFDAKAPTRLKKTSRPTKIKQ